MSGAMTEFRITSDLSALRGQVIDANFAEVREWLDENLAPYRSMAVSSDDLSTAKSYRASIRKVKDRIEQSRKEAKAAALAAYSEFESKCKELTGLCDEAANAIDSQVKAIEDAEKKEKIDALHAEYVAMTDDETESFLPWGAVNNPKWENKGYAFDTAVSEIRAAIENTRDELATIRSMGGDDTPYLLDVYRQTRDLSAVVRKASELKTMRQREEQRARDEAFRRQEELRRRQEAERMAAEKTGLTAESSNAPVIQSESPNIAVERYCVSFRVNGTKTQLAALAKFMKDNEIRYARIEE